MDIIKWEKYLVGKTHGRVKREGYCLTFKLQNGKTKEFEDILCNPNLDERIGGGVRYLGYLSSINYYFLRTFEYESEGSMLLNAYNGDSLDISRGVPYVSQNAKYVFNNASCYPCGPGIPLNYIEMFNYDNGFLTKAWQYELDNCQSENPKWISNGKLSIDKHCYSNLGDSMTKAYIILDKGKWKIVDK